MQTDVPPAYPPVRKGWYTRVMDVYRRKGLYIPLLPTVIRAMLGLRARAHVAVVGARGRRARSAREQWFESHRFFFGFGVYRSGTTFLANFLNQTVRAAIVQHEANVNDYYYYSHAVQSSEAAMRYVVDYRLAEMYFRLQRYSFDVYGEINPFLRRHCGALKVVFPEASYFHLVRDGRKVLRSLMSRELFARHDPMAPRISPPLDDPFYSQWSGMTRFERLCWMWQADNRFIRTAVGHTVRFEQVVTDYDYFTIAILNHLSLDVDSDTWKAHVREVENPTPRYRMGGHGEWSTRERKAFERICGDEMVACGYAL